MAEKIRKITVGDRYWKTPPAPTGAWYEYDEANGHMLELFLPNPTGEDAEKIVKGTLEIGFVSGPDTLVLGVRFASDREFIAPYSIHLVPDSRRKVPPHPTSQPAELKILLIDSGTGIIKGLRHIQMGANFSVKLHQAIRSQLPNGGSTKEQYLKSQENMMDEYEGFQRVFVEGAARMRVGSNWTSSPDLTPPEWFSSTDDFGT